MSKIKGRPKQAVRQEKNIGFYLTHSQYAVVQRKAAQARVNISDYMRQVALQAEVRAKWTDEEREAVKVLIGISVNLHRAMEIASAQGAAEAMAFFLESRDKMDEIIKKLCHDR